MLTDESFHPRSPRVKHLRRLGTRAFRASASEFAAEGPQAVREALGGRHHDGGPVAIEVFATAAATDRHRDLVALSGAVPWHVVDDDVVRAVSDTVSPQGVVARCRADLVALADALPAGGVVPPLVVVCADVRDPGNAGTVVRCADAAGAGAVVLAGTSVDPYNPKAVRASVGSVFHVDLVVEPSVQAAIGAARAAGLRVLAADGGGSTDLFDAEASGLLDGPTAWLLGNEAWGLPDDVAALADEVVAVPLLGRAESLNLATASAVCLYASARAHHRAGAALGRTR